MTMNPYQAESIRTLREFPPTREGQIELYRIVYPRARRMKCRLLENCSDEQIRSATFRMYQEAWDFLKFKTQSSFIKTAEQEYIQRLAGQLNIPEQEDYSISDLELLIGID